MNLVGVAWSSGPPLTWQVRLGVVIVACSWPPADFENDGNFGRIINARNANAHEGRLIPELASRLDQSAGLP